MNSGFICGTAIVQGFEPRHHESISKAFSEAWAWLVSERIVVQRPLQGDSACYAFSRRGESLQSSADVAAYIIMSVLASLSKRLEQFTLGSVLSEINHWLETGKSVFREEFATIHAATAVPSIAPT